MRRALALVAISLLVATGAGACSDDGAGSDDAGSGDAGSDEAAGAEDDTGAATEAGSTNEGETPSSEATTTTRPPPPELPRGGRHLFPQYRVVAYYGNPNSALLGVLGETPPEEAAARVEAAAAPFDRPDRPVLPAFELIVTVAQAAAGDDGDYSAPTDLEQVRRWHEAARAAGMLLILDIQPGRAPFLPEAQRYEELLREPDVGLALDAEWRMGPNEVPGQVIGSVTAAEVNEVSAWLAEIVAEEDLPEKAFVLHQFTQDMIVNRDAIEDRPGLATVFHIDGFGGQNVKVEKYGALKVSAPFHNGFKLFYDEDIDIFEPQEALFVDPEVDLITYQ